MDIDGEFAHGGKAPHHIFDGAGVDDHPADQQRVIDAADNPAREPVEAAAAGAGPAVEGHPVAGAIADHWHPGAAEVGDD